MKPPSTRPKRLSNPDSYCDEATRTRLLATPDHQLTWRDLQILLGPFTPAGTYEESAYFVPIAIEHIRAHQEDALDLVTSVVWFVSEYAARFCRDRVLHAARAGISGWLDDWTTRFVVDHCDEDACRKKGFPLVYQDLVRHSEAVNATLNDLVRFKAHEDIAIDFVMRIARAGSGPTSSAWFLELSRSYLEDGAFQSPRHAEIASVLGDADLAAHHFATVRSASSPFDMASTYWSDTRDRLTS